MPNITYFYLNSSHYVGVQLDWNRPTHYFPAVLISTEGITCYYPKIKSYEDVHPVLMKGFFTPPNQEQRMALIKHNTLHYHPSTSVQNQITNATRVSALEDMVQEIDAMEQNGLAFG